MPEPGTPAFLEWMRTLYNEGQRHDAATAAAAHAPSMHQQQSQCLTLLQDWLLQVRVTLPLPPAL